MIVLVVFLVVGFATLFIYQYQHGRGFRKVAGGLPENDQNQISPSIPVNASLRVYRNEKFGFEFQYPNGWTFHENTFYSPFSKFNLVGASPEENSHPDPLAPSLLINIVMPDFADRAFYDLKNVASETNVGGIMGSKYEYEYERSPKIAIILPFGQYKMILGAYKIYENIFNQILATFKFLEQGSDSRRIVP